MREDFKINSSLLAKNIILNFMGQVLPIIVALFSVPYVMKGLGVERFGILSLAWVVLEYFNLFDLGIGKATTRFVAEALGRGETYKISVIVLTSLLFVTALSIVGMISLICLTPLLIERVLNVPSQLIVETKLVFYTLSVSIIITLITATLNGVLEAYQRFDLINIIKIPSNILGTILPAIAIFFKADLLAIVYLLVIKNLCILIIYFFYCIKVMPFTKNFLVDFKTASSLLNYGAWIAIHNIAVVILLYLDRFLIGTFITLSAVTYYTVPYDLINRVNIIPSSIMMVLFPIFSTIGGESINKEKLKNLFNRYLKYLILIMGVFTGIIFVFSREILLLWLGDDFAENSTIVLQIFAIGVFFSSLAWLCGTLLQGIGRPKDVSIIHLLQVPVYIFTTWVLIKKMGITGAALSWSLRIALSLILLFFVCWKIKLFNFAVLIKNGSLKFVILFIAFCLVIVTIKSFISSSLMNLLLVLFGFIACNIIMIWKWILNGEDRVFIDRMIRFKLKN